MKGYLSQISSRWHSPKARTPLIPARQISPDHFFPTPTANRPSASEAEVNQEVPSSQTMAAPQDNAPQQEYVHANPTSEAATSLRPAAIVHSDVFMPVNPSVLKEKNTDEFLEPQEKMIGERNFVAPPKSDAHPITEHKTNPQSWSPLSSEILPPTFIEPLPTTQQKIVLEGQRSEKKEEGEILPTKKEINYLLEEKRIYAQKEKDARISVEPALAARSESKLPLKKSLSPQPLLPTQKKQAPTILAKHNQKGTGKLIIGNIKVEIIATATKKVNANPRVSKQMQRPAKPAPSVNPNRYPLRFGLGQI